MVQDQHRKEFHVFQRCRRRQTDQRSICAGYDCIQSICWGNWFTQRIVIVDGKSVSDSRFDDWMITQDYPGWGAIRTSDQTVPDEINLWSDHPTAQTILWPRPSPNSDHCQGDCSFKITSSYCELESQSWSDFEIVSDHRMAFTMNESP